MEAYVSVHNIDAEEVMGMFSAAQKRAPNATLCYLSAKMRAQKNKTVQYLDSITKERGELILKKAVALEQRKKRKTRQKDLMLELQRRQANKIQAKETTDRNKIEAKLKVIDVNKLAEELPDMEELQLGKLTDLITGQAVGQDICHVWYEEGGHISYNGKIEDVRGSGKKKKNSLLG